MTRFVRLSLFALLLGAPVLMAAPAGASGALPSGYEEVAQAQGGTQAQRPTRQRRQSASAQRRHRQTAQRPRRARAAQG